MERHKLSKSAYIRGLQCTKSLYLNKKRPFLRDKLSAEQRAKFKRGHAIGDKAHQLFPGGINLAPKTPFQYPQAVKKTAEALENNTPVIYEASFQHHKTLVALDILTFNNGKYYAWEVKSSLGISDTYINDAALQYWVITHSGIQLKDFSLITVNPDYTLQEPFVADDYFIKTSVLDRILPLQDAIEARIDNFLDLLEEKHSPRKKIGPQCNSPYPCDFQRLCWKKVPEHSVFDLLHLDEISKFRLYHKGIEAPGDIPFETLENDLLKKEITFHLKDIPYADKEIADLLKNAPDILFFTAIKPAFPLFRGMKPYTQFPVLAAFKNKTGISTEIFSTPDEGHQYLKEKLQGEYPLLVMGDLQECKSKNIFSVSELLQEQKVFLPELKGTTDIDVIVNTLINKNVQDGYTNRFSAGNAWEELHKNNGALPMEDITNGLRDYALRGIEACELFITRITGINSDQ